MDFIFLLQHPHMQNVFCFFLESINSYICGKALSLNSNELYFSFMNSKPCAISSSLKSDTIVFNVGTCLHFNNIKMEIKLQHNGVCPGISTSDSPVVRKFRIAIFTFMHFRKYVIRNREPTIRKRHMQNVKNVLNLVPLTWKLTLISICVTIGKDNYSRSLSSLHAWTDRSW